MKQNLAAYIEFVEKTIHETETKSTEINLKKQIDRLIILQKYHSETVRDFQHERLIHLLVTLFFALLMMASFIGVFLFSTISDATFLTGLMSAVAIILMITELFYIKHYYYLENGTQRLYKSTERLFEVITKLSLQK